MSVDPFVFAMAPIVASPFVVMGVLFGGDWLRGRRVCADCGHRFHEHSCYNAPYRCLKTGCADGWGGAGWCHCERFATVPTPPTQPSSIGAITPGTVVRVSTLANQSAAVSQQQLAAQMNSGAFNQAALQNYWSAAYNAYGVQVASPPPPVVLEKAEQTEPITAWRAWRVERLGRIVLLKSTAADTLYPAGKELRSNGEPSAHQHLGVHAWKDRAGVDQYLTELTKYSFMDDVQKQTLRAMGHYIPDPADYVFGTIALWGKVIEFERGYRAEYGYPQHLYVKGDDLARALRNTYGCEVTALTA